MKIGKLEITVWRFGWVYLNLCFDYNEKLGCQIILSNKWNWGWATVNLVGTKSLWLFFGFLMVGYYQKIK